MTVVYVPTILRSMEEIKKAFGVGDKQIKKWVEQGAPIVVDGVGAKKRYSTELTRLQMWREKRITSSNQILEDVTDGEQKIM